MASLAESSLHPAPLPLLVVICGATASGKTDWAIQAAHTWGCAVHGADSRQLIRALNIGTAKPNPAEYAGIRYYGLDLIDPLDTYSAPAFAAYTLENLAKEFAHSPIQILCGGTGFYIDAVVKGLDEIPVAPPHIREKVLQTIDGQGLAIAAQELATIDPLSHARIDLNNPRRIQRALEVFYTTGIPLSEWQQRKPQPRPFRTLWIAPSWPRPQLHARIAQRVDGMLDAGLLDEVVALLKQYPPDAPGLQTIGYAEAVNYLQGKCDYATFKMQIVQHTRQYAKRQLTWFRRNPDVHWLDATSPTAVADLHQLISRFA